MQNYRDLLRQKTKLPDGKIIQKDIESCENWDDAFWIGRCLFEQGSGESNKLIMDAYEKAFSLGLNIRVNREYFLTATQQIAKIYFQFQKYDEAINKLMVLDSNMVNLPDWVNLYYASAQIHTENILYWAEVPEMLFRRIDGINESDPESVRRRKFLYLEFLNRISELAKTKNVYEIDKDAILAKASVLGIGNSRECLQFKAALGIISFLPEFPDESEIEKQSEERSVSIYEQMVTELNKRLTELQAIIDKQRLYIEQDKKNSDIQQKQLAALKAENKSLEERMWHQTEELKAAKEHEYAIQAQYKALESQLSGSEAARKQLEENACLIGELQADVEDLKTALLVSRKNNDRLQTEIQQNQETIEGLRTDLLHSQEESQELHAKIESQKAQIEIAEAAVKAAEEKASAKERSQETKEVLGKTSKGSVQPTLLDILTVDNFLPRKQKILIIGGSETKESHLRGKLKSMGFDFSKDQLEFELEYDNVKAYAARIVPWSGKYAGVIVGPCPHKAKDTDGYSSFIEQMKSEEGYPHVEEARDKSGTLKISNASICDAMMRMAVHLQSIA